MGEWLQTLTCRLYASLLRLYPAAFRARFAREMAQVFRSQTREVYAQSGFGGLLHLWLLVFIDWVWAALQQWWIHLSRRRIIMMETSSNTKRGGVQQLSILQAGIAALPFLLFGLSSLVSRLEYFRTSPAALPLWQVLLIDPYLVFNWLLLIGLGIGVLRGFPRWGYAYLGWALLFGAWWSGMGFYGYTLGWKIWLPLIAALLIPLAIRRSWKPLRAMLAGMWADWTLLSLALYILYSWLFMAPDENHHPYLMLFIAATTIVISAGAWLYFRSTSPLRRVLALVGGLLAAVVIGATSAATWDYRAYYNLPESANNISLVGVILIATLLLIMLTLGLLSAWRQRRAISKH